MVLKPRQIKRLGAIHRQAGPRRTRLAKVPVVSGLAGHGGGSLCLRRIRMGFKLDFATAVEPLAP